MEKNVCEKLIQLNSRFYEKFAGSFSATRGRLQNGVMRVITDLPPEANILDLGCGNGELARVLAEQDFTGSYTGMDFSAGLLDFARTENPLRAAFFQADMADPDWDADLIPNSYSHVFAFAALHHMPSAALHREIFAKAHRLLQTDGLFIISNWQFLNSESLKARIQPWEKAGLTVEDVEANDYLLDWKRDGYALRYVHHFSEDEVAGLAVQSGFTVEQSFYSDGAGGNLGLYHYLRKG